MQSNPSSLPLTWAIILLLVFFASKAFSATLPDIIAKVRPAVVAVGTYKPTGSPRQTFSGTGFVVKDGHWVVTNNHVVPGSVDKSKREEIAVFSGRGRQGKAHVAKVVARDEAHDLALLYVSSPLTSLTLDTSTTVREGQDIAFTGFPIGMVLGLYPVTHKGIVAAIVPAAQPQVNSRGLSTQAIRAMRDPYMALQLDATAYPGNSGSPLYNPATGAVLGVINSVLVKATKESALKNPTGISYAIPVKFVKKLLAEHAR